MVPKYYLELVRIIALIGIMNIAKRKTRSADIFYLAQFAVAIHQGGKRPLYGLKSLSMASLFLLANPVHLAYPATSNFELILVFPPVRWSFGEPMILIQQLWFSNQEKIRLFINNRRK